MCVWERVCSVYQHTTSFMPSSFFHARGECAWFACICTFVCSHVYTERRFREKQVTVVSSPGQPDTRESQQTYAHVTYLNLPWLTHFKITTSSGLRQLTAETQTAIQLSETAAANRPKAGDGDDGGQASPSALPSCLCSQPVSQPLTFKSLTSLGSVFYARSVKGVQLKYLI